jgi:phenylalanyl-tRNA synthetase beta subunit
MKRRLERSGIRSISAVVDITNYVMLELGQPLHAYDDRLLDGALVVRFARVGETLTLLNEQELKLEPDLLLVADEKSRSAWPASWAASIPASAMRRPRCCSKAPSGILQ